MSQYPPPQYPPLPPQSKTSNLLPPRPPPPRVSSQVRASPIDAPTRVCISNPPITEEKELELMQSLLPRKALVKINEQLQQRPSGEEDDPYLYVPPAAGVCTCSRMPGYEKDGSSLMLCFSCHNATTTESDKFYYQQYQQYVASLPSDVKPQSFLAWNTLRLPSSNHSVKEYQAIKADGSFDYPQDGSVKGKVSKARWAAINQNVDEMNALLDKIDKGNIARGSWKMTAISGESDDKVKTRGKRGGRKRKKINSQDRPGIDNQTAGDDEDVTDVTDRTDVEHLQECPERTLENFRALSSPAS